ncbi:Interleukin-17 receptor D [Larimichthys crocea]|uniref:Uncharacterized protein n=1 Tax=Larimichthys crocea TaxID=215358 RepID=A0ACD3RJS2_LARCR|nr:Interleukin-17 receptor D [Larimichthys crocea]
MAAPRSFFISLCGLLLVLYFSSGSTTSGNKRANQERCGYKVQSGTDGGRRLAVTFRADNCSLNYPLGKHVIHEVTNVSFSHLACEDQAAVVVHWSASPLGIEHIKGFRVYLEKNPEGKQCQHLILKDPRQLNFSYKNTKLSSQPFSGLTFDTDYMVRVLPFPTLMNESFFPPSFLRTNSCEVLLGSDNLVCKPFWKPKTLNVSQLGSNLHVAFDQAPASVRLPLLLPLLQTEAGRTFQACSAANQDCPKHTSVIQSFAYFLQDFCNCEVVLDLWEHLEMCKEGQMSWLSRQLDEANFIITVCSKGLRYYVEKKSRRGKTPVSRRSNSSSSSSSIGGSSGDLFIVGVAMIAETLRLAKQSEEGEAQELNRYMTVYFDYSTENDIPTMLSLAPRFKLMDQLPQLYSRLHSSQSSLADRESQPLNVSRRNYFRSKSGRSLYVSICNMHQHISQNPDWFEKQLAPSGASSASSSKHSPVPADPAPSPPPKPHCSSSSSQPEQRFDSGLVLNEVVVKTPLLEGGKGEPRRNMLLLAPGSSPSLNIGSSHSPSPSPGLCPSPGLPHCSLSMLGPNSRSSSGISGLLPEESPSSSAPSILEDVVCPIVSAQAEEGGSSPPELPPPRDSGIYDSSVPSSELSIP